MKTLIFLLLLASSSLWADVNQAKALYTQAKALQNQKQYQAAIPLYIKSLVAEPRYAYSYKEIGTCKYMLGDKSGALDAYQRYISAVPSDKAVAAMITRIKSETGLDSGPAEPTGDAPPRARSRKTGDGESAELLWHSGFALSLGFGYNTYAMTDWNEYFKTPSAGTSGGTISSGFQVGLNVGYAMSAAMKLGLDVDYLMASGALTSTSPGGSTSTFSFPALWLGPKFEYGINMGAVKIPIQLGVGWMTLSGAAAQSNFGGSTFTTNYSGSGFGVKIGSGLDWALGKTFSLALNLGYRVLAGITPVVGTSGGSSSGSGASSSFTLLKSSSGATATPGNLVMDYSGLHAGLGLNFVF